MVLMPSYHQLKALSNSELVKTMRLAKIELNESKQIGENVSTTERTYLFFLNEWERRLKVNNRFYR